METKKVFEETERLKKETIRLKEKLNKLNLENIKMMELCPHELVFKFSDNHPRKALNDASYFCPSCGKAIVFIQEKQLKETEFKTSKIISLTNLSLIGTNDVFSAIRNEVYNNIDLYYNSNVSEEELTNKMESLLEDKQSKYKSPELMLRKSYKKN